MTKEKELTMMAVRLPSSLLKAAKMEALRCDMTLQDWVRKIIYENIN